MSDTTEVTEAEAGADAPGDGEPRRTTRRRTSTTTRARSAPVTEEAASDESSDAGADGAESAAEDGRRSGTTRRRRPVRRPATDADDDGGAETASSDGDEAADEAPVVELPGIDAHPDDDPQPTSRRRRRRRRGGRGGPEPYQQMEREPVNNDARDQREAVPCRGILDVLPEGYGFLRCSSYSPSDRDVYVSTSQIRRFYLRKGDDVDGYVRPARESEKFPALLRLTTVNDMDPLEAQKRPRFEDLTPLFPDSRLKLETLGAKDNVAQRVIDLISPIGKGQRGMIVSPSKAGKTTIMKQICQSIEANNPEVHQIVLLVDERPEEVTDMQRSVKGEVAYSTFDRPSDEHTQLAEVVIERAKRLVEMGRDVLIMLDGITRLARAYNLATPASGRILSGGVDSTALYPPKRFFGTARNIEEGGSLTILATALIETGSRMDEVIFEEFKGTGNWELRLDRRLSEKRVYPALDVAGSGTRKEELLFSKDELQQVWKLRRVMAALDPGAALELLVDKIKSTKSNDAFLAEIAKTNIM